MFNRFFVTFFSLIFAFFLWGFVGSASANCNCQCLDNTQFSATDEMNCGIKCMTHSGMFLCSPVATSNTTNSTKNDPVEPLSTSCTGGSCTLNNPLGNINTPEALIGRVIESVMGIVGSIALLMFVYGGLTWMTSAGSQEKVKKGKDILIWSAAGLVVVFMSYAITRVVLTALSGQ